MYTNSTDIYSIPHATVFQLLILKIFGHYDGTGPKNFQSPDSVDNQSGHSYSRNSSDDDDDDG